MSGILKMNPDVMRLQELVTNERSKQADAIIWLQGSRYDRGQKVLELYEKGFAPLIVVTGNNTRVVEDDNLHMDEILLWLTDHRVYKHAVMIDDRSMNTRDQAIHVVALAQERLWKKIILVGSTYHQLRAFLTFLHQAKKIGWQGQIINQPAYIDWGMKPSGRRKIAKKLFEEEIDKLKIYKADLATLDEGIAYLE